MSKGINTNTVKLIDYANTITDKAYNIKSPKKMPYKRDEKNQAILDEEWDGMCCRKPAHINITKNTENRNQEKPFAQCTSCSKFVGFITDSYFSKLEVDREHKEQSSSRTRHNNCRRDDLPKRWSPTPHRCSLTPKHRTLSLKKARSFKFPEYMQHRCKDDYDWRDNYECRNNNTKMQTTTCKCKVLRFLFLGYYTMQDRQQNQQYYQCNPVLVVAKNLTIQFQNLWIYHHFFCCAFVAYRGFLASSNNCSSYRIFQALGKCIPCAREA
jgi:hypothetical protein